MLVTRMRAETPAVCGRAFAGADVLAVAARGGDRRSRSTLPAISSCTSAERAFTHTREERGERTAVKWTDAAPVVCGRRSRLRGAGRLGADAGVLHLRKLGRDRTRRPSGSPIRSREPTAEVDKLAEEITRGITDRRQQAAAIYDWVAKNIRYFLVILGPGRLGAARYRQHSRQPLRRLQGSHDADAGAAAQPRASSPSSC